MPKISFIYFDVGGVAIKDFSDSNKWDIMIDQVMGIPPEFHKSFDSLYDKYEDDICLGKISVDDLLPFIKERFHAQIPKDFSMLHYFVDHFEPNIGLWEEAEKLPKAIKIGLLTDQYLGMLDLILSKNLIPNKNFTSIIDSSVLGVRKPYPQIYQIAQEKAGVPANEILFIDNREKNLAPAHQLGWQTYLYDSSNYAQSNKKLAAFFRENF